MRPHRRPCARTVAVRAVDERAVEDRRDVGARPLAQLTQPRTEARGRRAQPRANDARRVSDDDGALRHVARHDRPGPDDAVRADVDAVANDGVRADPHVVSDLDAPARQRLPEDLRTRVGESVVEADESSMRTEPDGATEPHRTAEHHADVDRAVVTDLDVSRDVRERGDVRPVAEP